MAKDNGQRAKANQESLQRFNDSDPILVDVRRPGTWSRG